MTVKFSFNNSEKTSMEKSSTARDQSETTSTRRFDLEERIMHCWGIVDDLDYIAELVEDNDQVSNLVLGLKSLYQAKFEKLWETFENSIK